MPYGEVLTRAAHMLWRHKRLPATQLAASLLGWVAGLPLAALGGVATELTLRLLNDVMAQGGSPGIMAYQYYQMRPLISPEDFGRLYDYVSRYGASGWIVFTGGVIAAMLALVLAAFALEMSVIASSAELDAGQVSGIGGGLKTVWRRMWSLLTIASVPLIPLTAMAIMAVVVVTGAIQLAGGIQALADGREALRIFSGLSFVFLCCLCPATLVTIPLGVWSNLAYRACLLEGMSAFASFGRAWTVIRSHLGPVAIFVLLQLATSLVIGQMVSPLYSLSYFLPGLLVIGVAIQSIPAAFFVIVWTLAWREWSVARLSDPAYEMPPV